MIFVAEWGDITQLATASFAARYKHDIVTVSLAALLALWAATGITVLVGSHLHHWISPRALKRVSAVVFALVGFYLIYLWIPMGHEIAIGGLPRPVYLRRKALVQEIQPLGGKERMKERRVI